MANITMPSAYDILRLLSLFFSLAVTPTLSSSATRRILHQPFFPKDSIPPDSSPTPIPTPKAFFPSYHSPQNPPSPTAPANISSQLFPQPSSLHRHPVIAIAVSVSLLSAALIALLVFFIYYRKYITSDKVSRSDSLRLYPPNTLTADAIGGHKPRPPSCTSASTSSEFLYLGTVVNSREACGRPGMGTSAAPYRKPGSPELKPLPPLPGHINRWTRDHEEEEEFFSPRGSSSRRLSPVRTGSGRVLQLGMNRLGIGSRSFNSTTPSHACSDSASLTCSPCLNLSPRHSLEPRRPMTSSSPSSPKINWNFPVPEQRKNSVATIEINVPVKKPPSPPALPPPRFWVLDPKKSNNIGILLRVLNVTIDEVCEALKEGNWDMLGTELESLLKMAPTKDEERKLKEFKDESAFKLGPAGNFLK